MTPRTSAEPLVGSGSTPTWPDPFRRDMERVPGAGAGPRLLVPSRFPTAALPCTLARTMVKSPKGNSEAPRFKSSLPTGAERFIATLVVRALDDNWRTPEDFMRHFPPQLLMQSLSSADSLRAALLIHAAGVHERIARKK